eukprot:TRINITY_DN14905_c0_g1_i1.p1 TRINITY_DN14905_c0_g1~~TRINITY_DN14905_c0_g1_i1.p1  ORF type:complete len:121 (-),score=14.42 TRINITY_DN14905_c0_g1_i1:8-370(-)
MRGVGGRRHPTGQGIKSSCTNRLPLALITLDKLDSIHHLRQHHPRLGQHLPIGHNSPIHGHYLYPIGFDILYSRIAVSYTHLRAHETPEHLVCRLLLEKKKKKIKKKVYIRSSIHNNQNK